MRVRTVFVILVAAVSLPLGYMSLPSSGAQFTDNRTGTITVKVKIPPTDPSGPEDPQETSTPEPPGPQEPTQSHAPEATSSPQVAPEDGDGDGQKLSEPPVPSPSNSPSRTTKEEERVAEETPASPEIEKGTTPSSMPTPTNEKEASGEAGS